MPQFDKVTFFNQIFWVTLVFFTFYFVILKEILPALLLSLKTRKKSVESYSSLKTLKDSSISIKSPL